MARYELRVRPSVAKDLRGIPKVDVRRILARIQALREDPRPAGCENSVALSCTEFARGFTASFTKSTTNGSSLR
jgi:hypothetical protein